MADDEKSVMLALPILLAVGLLLGGCGGFDPPAWNSGEWVVYRLPNLRAELRLELLPSLEEHLILQARYDDHDDHLIMQLELDRDAVEAFRDAYYTLIDEPEVYRLGAGALLELVEDLFEKASGAVLLTEEGGEPIRLEGPELLDFFGGFTNPTAPTDDLTYTTVGFLWKPETARVPGNLISMENGVLVLSEEVPISGLVHVNLDAGDEVLWLELDDYGFVGAVDLLQLLSSIP